MHPFFRNMRHRAKVVITALCLLALASLVASGMVGSVPIPLAEMPGALMALAKGDTSTLAATLLDLRLSRALVAFVTGGALALAGVMMQALLRNPLAEPYVLGISAGASVGALAALLFMWAMWMVDVAAFVGAVAVSMLLYLLARRDLRGNAAAEGGSSQLLLTGAILSTSCIALVTLMLSIAPESRLRSMIFWMIGDIAGAPLRPLPWIVLAAGLAFALRSARSLNVLALHAEAAATLGIPVSVLRKGLFFCSGILTASAVTSAGSIGFVGLIVPHACRFACGPDHRLLIPAATLAGGAFLVLADTLARTVLAPQQLPVGVITALIGAPVFLYQLHRLNRS
ncbi:FecCD family ABC transporter permease [Massilia antarctica]|uniref:FecCD family ABC transporter permease n=1 Tax=Massilia antarctica TaxID=2765360 RepID=UPI0006BB98E2|nr:iron ABC transporter permease [Massilia sp. H27-R4]MCY0916413.1 iron ABC transporter permease [Massilia sp. H27-R4]CUI07227.1 Vitamin B12 ABC transporter, permease component BtuC [Janthinobacterium sp. CG23_2]CUU31013.1 Vitamin B12 ABC transporter, permease component BtuC [Janthinobacterium sp. CG23_2]